MQRHLFALSVLGALLATSGCDGSMSSEDRSGDGGEPRGDADEPIDPGEPIVCDYPTDDGDTPSADDEADYYVTKRGDDTDDGRTRETAFATVQRGVDALQPGDTLVIGPGEYFESVRREDLGSSEADTTIRAEIPGTVVLRGDIPAPEFRELDGYRHVYVADFDEPHDIQVVNELDTLEVLERMPNFDELDYSLGTFYQDTAAGKLYLSTTDAKPATAHRYSLSVIPTHGLYLRNPTRVVIDGLAVTGFNLADHAPQEDRACKSTWGIFLLEGTDCTIRNSSAYLNGRGIGINSRAHLTESSGDNVVEDSAAWANISQYGVCDSGGMSLYHARRDVIRSSVSYLNSEMGMNHYFGDAAHLMENQSFISNSLAWGNGTKDFKNKSGNTVHVIDHVVGLGEVWFTDSLQNLRSSLVGGRLTCPTCTGDDKVAPNTIVFDEEEDLDVSDELADPANHDYRLQATSRFRVDDGEDRGPFPYTETIFYVSPDGDDDNDGLSVDTAWRTLDRAVSELEAGDTLYLEPGVYSEDLSLSVTGESGSEVSIRGRGTDPVVIEGSLHVASSSHVELERLHFQKDVEVRDSDAVRFSQCTFSGSGRGLTAITTTGLQVRHSTFAGFSHAGIRLACSKGAHLAGNLYDNASGVGLHVDAVEDVRYSDHNVYTDMGDAWSLDRGQHGRYSVERAPELSNDGGKPVVDDPATVAADGTMSRPAGTYRHEMRNPKLELVDEPKVSSVSATTANIEWMTSLPATTEITWGESSDGGNEVTLDVDGFGSYSLTGLEPDTTYYFTIETLSIPEEGVKIDADPTSPEATVSFTTLAGDPAPEEYYVSVDGDNSASGTSRGEAWRTIQHAANEVNVGDTVYVGGGTYQERVRIKATGAPGAPITFRSHPGEKVILDGADRALNRGFVVIGKKHLVFDGFQFANFNSESLDIHHTQWQHYLSGEFFLYEGEDITITRILSDGRNWYAARSVAAINVPDLTIRNMVATNKMSGALYLYRVPNLLIEHSAFVRPMISVLHLSNTDDQPALLRKNIFTDSLRKKAEGNSRLFTGNVPAMVQNENAYVLRSFFSPEERTIYNVGTCFENPDVCQNPVFVTFDDAIFDGYSIDELIRDEVPYDFDTFFTINSTLIDQGIGLQTDRFEDGVPN